MTTLPDRVLELLPADGQSVPFEELPRRGQEAGLKTWDVGSAMVALCADGRAVTTQHGGYYFSRRAREARLTEARPTGDRR